MKPLSRRSFRFASVFWILALFFGVGLWVNSRVPEVHAQGTCTPTVTTFTNSTPVAIPTGPAVVTSTINVSGVTGFLSDLNVTTFITHTFAADLDITIQSPAGTVVTLTTDNGAGNDDVFNGTVWDDDANPAGQVPYTTNNGMVTDHAYVNLTLASPLTPEEPLGAFIGENPNGTWTITISDDLAGDGGNLNSWSLQVSTLRSATLTSTSATNNTPVAIPTGPAVVTSTLNVAGAGTFLFDVNVTTFIQHTFAADLDVTIQSPAGTVVTLTTDNGAGNDNVFNGTVWDDDANPGGQVPYVTNNGMVTDHAYVNLTLASPLTPEEPLAAFIGENPNGTWTITISDDLAGDGGSLDSWTLNLQTAICGGPPTADPGRISGRITDTDGSPLGGTIVHLSGAANRTTISDSAGNYRFDNLDTQNFYSVSPSLVNYAFSPPSRSFSLVGNMTDAGFTANPDATQSANAIDMTEYFVRQQYLDFLGREPDQGGLDYWSAQINQCGGDANCIRNKRIDVSAAFFASAEFQQTGSYIYGLYAGTLGRTLNYGEFNADRSQVLGGSGLEEAKTAFAKSFVERPEFTNRYPQGLSREEFVVAVIQTMTERCGVDQSSLRNQLLGDYDSGGRALVVRHAAEASSFVAAEYNKAFVLMEYFGYLRREIDQGGYDYWLDVLNNGAAGNYRGMVCAFLTSTEYQLRFSTMVTRSNAECGP
jgi:subtilisin-like proprotein convertase family protein